MNPINVLRIALLALTAVFVCIWAMVVAASRRKSAGREANPALDARVPTAVQIGIGAVTNFFDTLGIGSFATTTAIFRALKLVPDRIIPGTLNAGHTLPTVVQAFIYTRIIPVDVLALFSMIGVALLAAAIFMTMRQLNLFPPGAEQIGVRGAKLAIGIAGNFALGALMTLGI